MASERIAVCQTTAIDTVPFSERRQREDGHHIAGKQRSCVQLEPLFVFIYVIIQHSQLPCNVQRATARLLGLSFYREDPDHPGVP